MLRLLSNRFLLCLLVVFALGGHLSATGYAAPPLASDLLSVVNGDQDAPALASKAPQAETRLRIHEPRRFADPEPGGAAIPPAVSDLPGRGRPILDPDSAAASLVPAAVVSPGQRAPPAPLHTV